MINLEWKYADGTRAGMSYDVHPGSHQEPIRIPAGAACVTVWLGTAAVQFVPETA